jgi:uncharacterized membrane protein
MCDPGALPVSVRALVAWTEASCQHRIFGTMTDMSVNYLWLGSLPSAGGLAVVSAVASSALYFVHELAWSRFESPPVLVGDLPGVGVEGPGP